MQKNIDKKVNDYIQDNFQVSLNPVVIQHSTFQSTKSQSIVIKSKKDGKLYTGSTTNLWKHFNEHD